MARPETTLACAALWLAGCAAAGELPRPDAPEPALPCAPGSGPPPELSLEWALPIDGPSRDLEPSGLALRDGRLFTVSDKTDDVIFELVAGTASVEARPYLRFRAPAEASAPLDLEGIAAVPGGAWLLASEGADRVLLVGADGASRWSAPSHRAAGRAVGLLSKPGAGTEGIAVLPNGTLLLAAEREPRGFIELDVSGAGSSMRALRVPPARCAAPSGRTDDLADLATWRGQVYGLQRNAHLIVRWERTPEGWRETGASSYARTENDPRFAYRNRSYGLAEGLAIDDQRIHVVLDNNQDERLAATGDRRPLLLTFRNDLAAPPSYPVR